MTKEHRIYKTVEVEMWDDLAFRQLSPLKPSGQALWIYLLTGRRTTKIPGVVVARPAVLADDLRWPVASLELCLGEAIDEGIAKADVEAGIVWLPRALRHSDGTPRKSTKPTSLNHFKGWARGWDRIPDCPLKVEIWGEVKALAYALSDAYADAFNHAFPDAIANASPIQVAGSSEQVAGSRTDSESAPAPAALSPNQATGQEQVIELWTGLYSAAYSGERPTWGIRQMGIADKLVRDHGLEAVERRARRLFESPPSWLKPPYTIATLEANWDRLVEVAQKPGEKAHGQHRVDPNRKYPSGVQEI